MQYALLHKYDSTSVNRLNNDKSNLINLIIALRPVRHAIFIPDGTNVDKVTSL